MTQGEITTRPTLARLTEEGKQIQTLLLDAEIQDKETLHRALGQVEVQWLTKVENIGHLVRDMEYLIDNFGAELDKLTAQGKALVNRKAWLLDYLLQNMMAKGENKLQFPLVTVSVINNPPSVEVYDEKIVPASYKIVRTEIVINKHQMLEDMKAGKEISGARLITDRRRIQIR